MKQYGVLKLLGMEEKKFKKLDKALEFWKENKDYNSVRELTPIKKMVDGKEKTIYKSKFLKGRFRRQNFNWKGEDYWRFKK